MRKVSAGPVTLLQAFTPLRAQRPPEREQTNEDAVWIAIRRSLEKASRPLWRIDRLARWEGAAAWIGIAVLLLSIVVSSAAGVQRPPLRGVRGHDVRFAWV